VRFSDVFLLNEVGAAVLIAKPALVGIEAKDATGAAAQDATGVAVRDAIEVEGLDVAEVAAMDVGSPADAAAVWGEPRVLGEFVVARDGPAVERVAFEVVAEVEPGEFRAERDEPGVGPVWSQVESGAPEIQWAAFVAGLDGSPVAWGEWVGLRDGCPVEL
jgi:hypothetical protein